MKTSYRERDYVCGAAMLTLRTAIGLTQKSLANLLGVSRRAVGEWEAGSSYPKVEHLKQVIVLAVRSQAWPIEREAEEIRLLWKVTRQKVLLDEHWLSALLSQRDSSRLQSMASRIGETVSRIMPDPASGPRVDWDDAPPIPFFYGREQELAQISQWVLQEHTRVVSILGMGGIGKSALSVSCMHQLAVGTAACPCPFEVIIFRSLRYAPSCDALLDEWLQAFSLQPLGQAHEDGANLPLQPPVGTGESPVRVPTERRVSLLLEHLRKTRTLLVLDNLEGLLLEGDARGRLRPGFEGYEQLLRRVAETNHQSTLLLTSREKFAELRPLEGKHAAVRSLRLKGLDVAACKQLLAEKELVGTEADLTSLIEVYGGNPLALKIVAETIKDLFGGEVGEFLAEGTLVFGNITDLLSEQFSCLSTLEQSVVRCLAMVRESVTLDELLAMLVNPPPRFQVLEAIDAVHRRSLIEPGKRPGSFSLQAVMLEYVTTVLNAEGNCETQQYQPDTTGIRGPTKARKTTQQALKAMKKTALSMM
jgi:transcriptional regulator with XRE-family HTH domain